MKKLILSLIAISTVAISGYGQCTPDAQYNGMPGVYPDSATGLPASYVGNPYDEVITVVVPADTLVDNPLLPGTQVLVDIDYVELTSVTGLPPNFTYDCTPVNCQFAGGTSGCVSLYSTQNPVTADIGTYPLVINTNNVPAAPYSSLAVTGSYDYYYIDILDSTGVNVGIKKINSESFELKTIYPNPVVGNSKIQFISGKNQPVTFTVTNVLGKNLVTKNITATRGVNDLYVSAFDFPNGIYLYSITADGKTSTKRMIIRK